MHKRLVPRGQQRDVRQTSSTPARQQSNTSARQRQVPQTISLPTYQAPLFPMSAQNQRALAELTTNNAKYKSHVDLAVKTITAANAEVHDRLYDAEADLAQVTKRVASQIANGSQQANDDDDGNETGKRIDSGRSEVEEAATMRAQDLASKVEHLHKQAEKSLRELIDYNDEMMQQAQIMTQLKDQVAIDAARPPPPKKMKIVQRPDPEDPEQEVDVEVSDDDIPEMPVDVLSPTEIYKQLKQAYDGDYSAQSMRKRYATHNDYVGFIRSTHDAKFPNEGGPPVPHASTWFPNDSGRDGVGPSNRNTVNGQHTNADDSGSDDDLQIAGEKTSLICPLTQVRYKQPYSNAKCPHIYEKTALIEYFHNNAAAEGHQVGRRQVPKGPKTLQCVVPGCSVRFELSDFKDDPLAARKVRRAELEEQKEREEGLAEDGSDDIDDVDEDSE